MAVDLSESQYIDSLKRAVTPLATPNVFSAIPATMWLGYLTDAFWEAKMDGFLAGYTEADGEISSTTGGADLGREFIALVAWNERKGYWQPAKVLATTDRVAGNRGEK